MKVTRPVIADLWALANAGEASEDSRRLVDEFLAADPEFKAQLSNEENPMSQTPDVTLPSNHEAQTLDRTRKRLRRRSPFHIVALALTGLAAARLIEDTTFVGSPRRAIATAIAAGVFWIITVWHTRRLREKALVGRSA